ncbi:MAG: GGDEF domain-containing protein [Pseudomonadota bacterium]|nr:GGDEF domain-containing protein [Pseudomonadota bacterium]
MLLLGTDFIEAAGVAPLAFVAMVQPRAQIAMGEAIGTDLLLSFVLALAVVAAAAVSGVVGTRRKLRQSARKSRHHAESMEELLRTVRMAENIADLGVWQYDPKTGRQFWSDGMRRLFGVDHDEEFVAGDAETLLFANDIDLIGDVMERSGERLPFALQYEIHGFEGLPRLLSVQGCNLHSQGGAVDRVVAVVRDVTDQVSRERALETSREAAMIEARRARELAETDPLTGLANRRRVMCELDRMILSSRTSDEPLVLILFDIDHFKSVNDTYGHPEGDRVLQRVAELAHGQARDGDLVGRIGGEEFVWIIPGVNGPQAEALAERLRAVVSHKSAVGAVPGVTVSAGLAVLEPSDTSLTIFSRADAALYDAKHAGRNLVQVAA